MTKRVVANSVQAKFAPEQSPHIELRSFQSKVIG